MFAIRSLCQSYEPARLRQDSFQYRNNVQSHWSDTLRGPRAGFGSAIPPRSQNRSLVRLRACSPSIQGASHTHWSRASGLFHTSRAVGHLGGRSTPFQIKGSCSCERHRPSLLLPGKPALIPAAPAPVDAMALSYTIASTAAFAAVLGRPPVALSCPQLTHRSCLIIEQIWPKKHSPIRFCVPLCVDEIA